MFICNIGAFGVVLELVDIGSAGSGHVKSGSVGSYRSSMILAIIKAKSKMAGRSKIGKGQLLSRSSRRRSDPPSGDALGI
jgi:hypothetical protein